MQHMEHRRRSSREQSASHESVISVGYLQSHGAGLWRCGLEGAQLIIKPRELPKQSIVRE